MSQSTTDRSEAGPEAEPWGAAHWLAPAHLWGGARLTPPTVDWTLPN